MADFVFLGSKFSAESECSHEVKSCLLLGAGDIGSVCGMGRPSEVGNGNPLQYSWRKFHGQKSLVGYSPWDTFHGLAKSRIQLNTHLTSE